MLAGKSQTLELHPMDAGCAFLQNAFWGASYHGQADRQDESSLHCAYTLSLNTTSSACTLISPVN